MDYRAYFQRVGTLSIEKRARMAEIYFESYAGSDKQRFYVDLDNKDEVLLLEFEGQLVGFSTLQFIWHENALIAYSGDTIVMPEHWRQQILHGTWLTRMAMLQREYPGQKLYWLLLVKGIRTYKYLKIFARNFYPHWQNAQPELERLANSLAREKFGALYNPQTGVVECPESYGHLSTALAAISPALQAKPEVEFFLRKNPHYARGHELVCLCDLALDNLSERCKPFFVDPQVEFRDE